MAFIPGGSLPPTNIPKYQTPLVIPPAMPKTATLPAGKRTVDYYEIAARQFQQQILPPGLPVTTVWSYGSVQHPGTAAQGGSFNYPAFTIEARYKNPVQVKWINDLVDANGNYLPHLLPVDQTLHWANPPGGIAMRDSHGHDPLRYQGPVPLVTHVHGAHTYDWADGYTEAWYLPAAVNIPPGFATVGSHYDSFKALSPLAAKWTPGSAVFEYPNDQGDATLWYHDHSLGMTRVNIYAGPVGFYLLRGAPDNKFDDRITGKKAVLPGPAPALGDAPGTKYYEIPIAIQDRSFNVDGSLFYSDNRAFFEGLDPAQLQIPFSPSVACDGQPSDVAPIWNPEFFGNTMVVNGATWPYLNVEQRRYRLRFLNGCNSRFLILRLSNGTPFMQIGAEGGYLPAPVQLTELLLAPAERADVIVDFTNVAVGTNIILQNFAPDAPYGGGVLGVDFTAADPDSTGQVMQFSVVAAVGVDNSTPAANLVFPGFKPIEPEVDTIRPLSLNELDSASVRVVTDAAGNITAACTDPTAVPFGPVAAMLGGLNPDGTGKPLRWMDPITEKPAMGTTEVWEIHNFTMDAHPIHIHLVQFQVLNRQKAAVVRPPELWETGRKDTVIAYPGEITRVRAFFDRAGLYTWHCHIVEHEDNEMMRPLQVIKL